MNRIGEIITFGKFYWRVLKIEGNAVLIITDKIVEQKAFIEMRLDKVVGKREQIKMQTRPIWEWCDMRKYLNAEFYKNTFNNAERSRILGAKLWNKNYEKEWEEKRHIEAGFVPPSMPDGHYSEDKIFLLSIDEVETLFENATDRITTYNGEVRPWWLRSDGFRTLSASTISRAQRRGEPLPSGRRAGVCVDQAGNILREGGSPNSIGGGVRPALFLER